MTYISETLDEICRKFCPICNMCAEEHECVSRRAIKDRIIEMVTEDLNDR